MAGMFPGRVSAARGRQPMNILCRWENGKPVIRIVDFESSYEAAQALQRDLLQSADHFRLLGTRGVP